MKQALHATLAILLFFTFALQAQNSESAATNEKTAPPAAGKLGQYFKLKSGDEANLRVVNNNFVIYFKDEEGETPDELPYPKAVIIMRRGDDRIPYALKPTVIETVNCLTAVRFVEKPYQGFVILNFFEEGSGDAVESFSFRFDQ